jgi:hypothetical protein
MVIKTNRKKKALGNLKSRCLLSPEDLACHFDFGGAALNKASNTALVSSAVALGPVDR